MNRYSLQQYSHVSVRQPVTSFWFYLGGCQGLRGLNSLKVTSWFFCIIRFLSASGLKKTLRRDHRKTFDSLKLLLNLINGSISQTAELGQLPRVKFPLSFKNKEKTELSTNPAPFQAPPSHTDNPLSSYCHPRDRI